MNYESNKSLHTDRNPRPFGHGFRQVSSNVKSGQAGMIFMTFVVIDFFLIPLFIFTPSLGIGIIIVFGFCGTLSWFFLPILIGNLIEFLKNRRARKREIIKS